MAVEAAHRGQAVQCPHCQHVVQVPGVADAAVFPGGPAFNVPAPAEGEDIFAPPEESPGDDLFGGPAPVPTIEMPVGPPLGERTEKPESKPVGWQAAPGEPAIDTAVTYMPSGQLSPTGPGDGAGLPSAGFSTGATATVDHGEPPASLEAPARPARKKPKGSMVGPLMLIFLVPYSIVTTAFIGWQIYSQGQNTFDPLQQLPDPSSKPASGGARRIHPHSPMPTKLKTSLGQPLRLGDLEVTPVAVQLNPMGQLALHLKLRNASQDVVFNPLLPADAYRFKRISMADTGPYTYLELGAKRLYGLGADWDKVPPRKEGEKFDGSLQPGEEMSVVFHTRQDDKAEVAKAAGMAQGTLLWRVQLRRGLVAVGSKEVSATAVFGIEFAPRAITAERGEVEDASAPPPVLKPRPLAG
jgi:hypothetical protein